MTLNKLKAMWDRLEVEESIEWYEDDFYTCNECKRNVPEEEFDKSLVHCIECHGG